MFQGPPGVAPRPDPASGPDDRTSVEPVEKVLARREKKVTDLPDDEPSAPKSETAVEPSGEVRGAVDDTAARHDTIKQGLPRSLTLEEPQAPPPGSVTSALVALEERALSRYCHSICVQGDVAQSATLNMHAGQTLWCARGALMAYNDAIEWHLEVPGGAGKAVSRALSGEGVTLTRVTAIAEGARVTLSANQPGKLATWDLTRGAVVCTSGSFVAAVGDVNIEATLVRSPRALLFGGVGLFLQRLTGTGVALIHGSGDFVEYMLRDTEKLLVSTGNVALFSDRVKLGVRRVGGCLKSILGGEGLFVTELTGPGWVMLQSLKKLPGRTGAGGRRRDV